MESEITIIMPAYNAELSIEKCIDSIINQTIQNWYLVIIDDGSKDHTLSICQEYANVDNRITVIHKENGGVSSARNAGIEAVVTPYFVCVDSDDSVEPDYLETLLNAAQNFPDSGHVWCGYQTVSKTGIKPNLLENQTEYLEYDRRDILKLYVQWYAQMPWHRLYKTSVVQGNMLRMNENMSLGEDLLFNLDYLDAVESTSIVIANKACYNYTRTDNDSLDHKYREDLFQIYGELHKKLWECIKKWGVTETDQQIYYNSCFYHYEAIFRNTFHKDNKNSLREKIFFNNKILKSEGFLRVFGKTNCYINPVYKLAYSMGRYEIVLLLDNLVSLKRRKKK